MICVHCGVALQAQASVNGLYQHEHWRWRCQSDSVPYGHMGHPEMPCPQLPGDPNPCQGSSEGGCEHLHRTPASPTEGIDRGLAD